MGFPQNEKRPARVRRALFFLIIETYFVFFTVVVAARRCDVVFAPVLGAGALARTTFLDGVDVLGAVALGLAFAVMMPLLPECIEVMPYLPAVFTWLA